MTVPPEGTGAGIEADTNLPSRQEWALKLARQNLSVFPLQPNSKQPRCGVSWLSLMTTDESVIRQWFEQDEQINYGVCPGENFVIVDLDRKNANGLDAFALLELEHGSVDTFAVETPSGGRHLYLAVSTPCANAHRFPAGIDVRGARGYVVGPGSVIDGKPYEAKSRRISIAPAPRWIACRLRKSSVRDDHASEPLVELDDPAALSRARAFLRDRAPAIEGQGGNDDTYATACMIKDMAVSEEQCLALMLEPGGWNDRCEPRWTPDELATVVRNAYRYGINQPGSKGGGAVEMFGPLPLSHALPQDVATMRDASQQDAASNRWATLTHIGAAIAANIEPPETVIAEWLPAHGYTVLLAKRGGWKTLVMLDLALCLATDRQWCGQPTQEGFYAIYLCGEDQENTAGHVKAWCDQNNGGIIPDRFVFVKDTPNLMDTADCRLLAQHLRSIMPPGSRAVLFVDTWQRASRRGGQNRDDEMHACVASAEALARGTRGPAVIAFHPPKHDGTVVMGSSVIENASSAIWLLADDAASGLKKLQVTRIKGRGLDGYQKFAKKESGLQQWEAHGGELTGAFVVRVGGSESEKPYLDRTKLAYGAAIRKIIIENDQKPEGERIAEWTIAAAAKALAGASIEVDGEEVRFSGVSQLRQLLPKVFAEPLPFGDGNELALVATGERHGKGIKKVFRLRRSKASSPYGKEHIES